MLGEMDFPAFEEVAHPYLGKLLYVLYIIFMMITLLNFIIAILSDTYANYSGKS
jgi:hypothetical protein